jgi:hypothetical protein
VNQASDFGDDLTDGADVRQSIQGHGNVEVIFELANELEDLERVESEIGKQRARKSRLDRLSAQPLEDVDGVAFEPIGRYRRIGERTGMLGLVAQCILNVIPTTRFAQPLPHLLNAKPLST